MGRHRGRRDEYYSSSTDDDDPIWVERERRYKDKVIRAKSGDRRPRRRESGENIKIINRLDVPGGFPQENRQRSSSTSGQPQPIIMMPNVNNERSRSRGRRHSSSRSHSRSRERERERELERLRQQVEDMKYKDARASERDKWERERDDADRAAKKKQDEYRKLLEEQEREADRKREQYKHELEEARRQDDEKRARYAKEAAEKAKAEAEERKRIALEAKLAEEKKEAEREEEEKRILREHAEREKKKKEDEKALREKILREEAEKKREEEEKKKQEEIDFEEKIRHRAIEAGWSKSYADDLLNTIKGKQRDRSRSPGVSSSTSLVVSKKETYIDMDRPTWIRISTRHILPETLNAYRLKWDYDPEDEDYIIIKEYIDHDLQRDLFAHTKKIIKSRKTITDGYTKETISTTLKPNTHVVRGRDQMFLVRKKSKSPAPDRRRSSYLV